MIISEVELFKELGTDFMSEVADLAQEETWPADKEVFTRGASADHLYVLVEGSINLFIKDAGSLNFSVDSPGDVFGWSSLVEPKKYTASAQCYEESKVLKIDGTRLEHIFERHPNEAYKVMKRLAGVIAERLKLSYEDHLRSREPAKTPSYG